MHLGALTRRLRLLGVDAAHDKDADDDHLVERAGREDRVLLSRDRGLLMRKRLRRAAFVRGQHPDAQLADFIERFHPPLQPWSLCLACGGTLGPVSKAQVANQLEPGDVAHAAAILQVPVLRPRLLAWSARRQTAASGPALHMRQ